MLIHQHLLALTVGHLQEAHFRECAAYSSAYMVEILHIIIPHLLIRVYYSYLEILDLTSFEEIFKRTCLGVAVTSTAN